MIDSSRIPDAMVEAATTLLLARSGGHFEAIRDMSDEKAGGDARAVLAAALGVLLADDEAMTRAASACFLVPVHERDRVRIRAALIAAVQTDNGGEST